MSSDGTGDGENSEKTSTDKPKHLWMVKPCEHYVDEYSDCRSFKARFHQYFITGETTDCSSWKKDIENCRKWEDSEDRDAVNEVIESEKGRIRDRLQGHYNNDVWERRKTPLSAAEWNPPLPHDIEQRYQSSFLKSKADALKSGQETLGDVDENIKNRGIVDTEQSSYCCIV